MILLRKNYHNIIFAVAIMAFVGNILYIWNSPAMRNSWMGNDEYFFYRTTMNLPNVETTGGWLVEDVAPKPEGVDNPASLLFDKAYTTPIWVHPLVANAIAYPVAMLFDDVVEQIQLLRLFDIAMITATVFLFLDVIRQKTNGVVAAVSILPMFVGRYLLANGIMFYNDLFMWFFFALTMWTITKTPRLRYVLPLAVLTVLMKGNAPLLLLPILVYYYCQTGNKSAVAKVGIASSVAVIGYMVFQAVVAGDALYVFHHWGNLNYATRNFSKNVLPHLWDYAVSWGLWLSIPLIVAGMIVVAWKRMKAWYGFAAFGLVTLLYSFCWGFFAYQVFPVMYASMFMIPVMGFSKAIERGE